LPHGAFAGLTLDRERAAVAPLLDALQEYRGQHPEQIAVDLAFDGNDGPRRLTGRINGIYGDQGLLRWRTSAMKGADILGLWLAHLAWCASGPPVSGGRRSAHYGADGSFVITTALTPAAARQALADYLALYWEGVHQPLLLLPKASYAYALKCHVGGRGDPMNAARSGWQGNGFNDIPGDRDDVYIQLVRRDTADDPLDSPDFTRLAHAFYDQALQTGELAQ
jgi:exodeoxyribonuclease V gamma subunit